MKVYPECWYFFWLASKKISPRFDFFSLENNHQRFRIIGLKGFNDNWGKTI